MTALAARYLVLAVVCDCGGVAVSVLDGCYERDNLEPGEDEVLYVGPDWEPLVARAVQELHMQTGLPVLARCTAIYMSSKLPDRREQELRLDDEVRRWLYAAYPNNGRAA